MDNDYFQFFGNTYAILYSFYESMSCILVIFATKEFYCPQIMVKHHHIIIKVIFHNIFRSIKRICLDYDIMFFKFSSNFLIRCLESSRIKNFHISLPYASRALYIIFLVCARVFRLIISFSTSALKSNTSFPFRKILSRRYKSFYFFIFQMFIRNHIWQNIKFYFFNINMTIHSDIIKCRFEIILICG